jgi:ribosome maturation factor RimP
MSSETISPEGITDRVRRLAEDFASSRGLEVFQVEYKPSGQLLRVFLDRRYGQVSIDDCSAVSEKLSIALDEQDLIPHAYRLEVSSPGLDRPLRNEEDYRRFRGEKAKFLLSQPINGTTSLRGAISEVQNSMLRIEPEAGEPLWLPLTQIRSARLDPLPSPAGPNRGPKRTKKKR